MKKAEGKTIIRNGQLVDGTGSSGDSECGTGE